MKKVLKTAVVAVAAVAISANAYSLWNLTDGQGAFSILDPSATQGGAFYSYDDRENNDGGSYIAGDWPAPSTERDVYGSYLAEIGGRIEFVTTADYQYSFAGVGFNWLDPEAVFNPTSVAGGGVSVCYKSEKKMIVDLKVLPGDKYEYNSFVKALEPSSSPKHVKIAWSEFAQGDWGGTGEEPGGITAYLNFSAGIQFKFEGGGAADRNVFHLGGVGWYNDADECDREFSGTPILYTNKLSGFSLAQNGRVLQFNGLDRAATVQVINLQGRLVSEGVIGASKNSLNLSNLSSGVYMVRISGERLNFTQKVMLR